eukprot:TRINITY_DN152_c0_g1_i1.p1 TRINITY_DN152_c0_g1~~TRINITY_DN152_c0_g1_i1.p1  ORF type:complete len:114 (+),score=7.26 TRINITY_DN152_c0_g1_i1:228-569(+)
MKFSTLISTLLVLCLFSVTVFAVCDTSRNNQCMTFYKLCINNAKTNSGKACQCAGAYGRCSYDSGCASDSDWTVYKDNCVANGCTAKQCSSSSSVRISSLALSFSLLVGYLLI